MSNDEELSRLMNNPVRNKAQLQEQTASWEGNKTGQPGSSKIPIGGPVASSIIATTQSKDGFKT